MSTKVPRTTMLFVARIQNLLSPKMPFDTKMIRMLSISLGKTIENREHMQLKYMLWE